MCEALYVHENARATQLIPVTLPAGFRPWKLPSHGIFRTIPVENPKSAQQKLKFHRFRDHSKWWESLSLICPGIPSTLIQKENKRVYHAYSMHWDGPQNSRKSRENYFSMVGDDWWMLHQTSTTFVLVKWAGSCSITGTNKQIRFVGWNDTRGMSGGTKFRDTQSSPWNIHHFLTSYDLTWLVHENLHELQYARKRNM